MAVWRSETQMALNSKEGTVVPEWNRVVVTGMGAVTPVGTGTQQMWEGIKAGKCGIGPIQAFDTARHKVTIAAEIHDFTPQAVMDAKEIRRTDRFCQLAIVAANEAWEQSRLGTSGMDPERMAVIYGSGVGGLYTLEKEIDKMMNISPDRVSPLMVPMIIVDIAAGQIAMRFGLKGNCSSIVTACATGAHCIGEAMRAIRHGYADAVLCGGTEAPISPIGVAGFANMTALCLSNDPERASIPFDKDRSGFVMGEGAGAMVLESLESALKRGATILAEIKGYGTTCDAYHITAPDPEGMGATRAMRAAIQDADLTLEDIGYINAHGTSTPFNDKIETLAIKNLFGEKAYQLPVSSTKSMTGHLLGAAGAVESIISTMILQDGFLPPTIGYRNPDPECDLDYIPNQGRETDVRYVMSNSFGFGGHNCCLVFGKYIP